MVVFTNKNWQKLYVLKKFIQKYGFVFASQQERISTGVSGCLLTRKTYMEYCDLSFIKQRS